MSLHPWLEDAASRLAAARAAGRLPHALLIHESPGTGAIALAAHFAQLVFCTGAAPPCGECRHCRRVAAGEHPDFILLGPDAESKLGQITVEQVRDLSEQLVLSSYEGRGTVAVLHPAEALNRHAANALLKTLEEPRADAHLILLTGAPSLLPATIRSRCQRLTVPAPDRDAAIAWLSARKPAWQEQWPAVLEVLGVSPLEALESDPPRLLAIREDIRGLLEAAGAGRLDVIRTAEAWAKDDPVLRLRCLENCLTADLLAMRAGARLQGGASDMNMGPALGRLAELRGLRRELAATSLSKPLALERALWRIGADPAEKGPGTA